MINPWARLAFWFVVLLAFAFFGSLAHAQEMNEQFEARISICLTKDEAVAILKVEKEKGTDAGVEKFQSSKLCDNIIVLFTPHKVVAEVKTGRGIFRVIEIKVEVNGVHETAYWLTSLYIKGANNA